MPLQTVVTLFRLPAIHEIVVDMRTHAVVFLEIELWGNGIAPPHCCFTIISPKMIEGQQSPKGVHNFVQNGG